MPELPEVETVRRGLEPVLSGARLQRVAIHRPDLRVPFPARFVERLTGARVASLSRRGKYLLAALDTEETLIMHLGMSGRFVVVSGDAGSAPSTPLRHAHAEFETDAGARVAFVDARRFGLMELCASKSLITHPLLAGLGREPLSRDFDAVYLAAKVSRRRQGVKAVLLDQTVVAGIGNIYACEALHRARIAPDTPANTLGGAALERLVKAIRAVLREAIEAGGSTLRDYAGADGAPGYFQHRFGVYGRQGEACVTARCGGIVRRVVQAGRATFYCPKCQT